jgi:uncharacterized protein (TIGR00297 family)
MSASWMQILVGSVLSAVTAVVSLRLRFLTAGGSAAQFLLGALLFGLGGWAWAVPVLTFFLSSSLLSRLPKRDTAIDEHFAKGTTRDASQVLANGGIGAVLVLLWSITLDPLWYAAYLGALGAAAADTWGTEVGTRLRVRPRLITTLQPADPGTSGAISPGGTLGGLAGGLLVALSGVPWSAGPGLLVPITAASLAGSLIDSLAGATIQARYRCVVCGRATERRVHCEGRTVLEGGMERAGNEAVNLLCTVTGALVAFILAQTA